ncbi:hypothetical protein Tco_1405984 [Tanacetum coccineum]
MLGNKHIIKLQTQHNVTYASSKLSSHDLNRCTLLFSCRIPLGFHTSISAVVPLMYRKIRLTASRRLISWQCKKQTIVATSSTEAEYVAAASCCAQVLWIQNQMLDYGFNFMNTKIFIDNQSTICIVKNPVFHQRTKHIEIRHHFIRDANEKNLIQVLKIHTDDNVADLLTKAFDGPRFAYLVVHIGMVDNTAARCTFFLLTGLVSAGSTMVLLVAILSAGRLVSAGSTMVLLVAILSAGRLVSAGSTMILLVVILPAGCLVSAVILPAGRMVSAGCTMVLLVVILPAGCFVSDGCIPAVCMVSAVGGLFLLAEYIHAAGVVYAANTSIHAAGLVCAGSIMVLLADLFLLVVSWSYWLTYFCWLKLYQSDPDSDDEVLAEILFRGQSISGHGVVIVDKLPDDEIVDPRVKDEPVSDYATSPPRSRRKHHGVRSDDSLWDKPVEDFFSSESESDDDIEDYIPPIPYGAFKDWEIVRCPLRNTYYHVYYQENRRHKNFFYLKELLPHVYREDLLLLRRRMNRYFRLNPDVDVGLDLWRDVNLLCQSLHSDDVEDFWRTQDEWVVSSWKLYPRSSVHVLDLTNGKTVYMFVGNVYPIRVTLLERMLRHRLTVPPSYCRDVVVAGNVIQTVQAGLRESYECLASAPLACTARQMVFSSPWLTAKKESGSPLQTALWLVQEGTALGKDLLKSVDGCQLTIYSKLYGYRLTMFHVQRVDMVINPPWNLPFLGAKGLTSPEQTATGINTPGSDEIDENFLNLLYILSNGAVAVKTGTVADSDFAASFVSCVQSRSNVPADYVSAGHVLVPADRDRIC